MKNKPQLQEVASPITQPTAHVKKKVFRKNQLADGANCATVTVDTRKGDGQAGCGDTTHLTAAV